MAAYAALVSLMHIIHNLENHPRPPISLHKNQTFLITQKITFLQQFLEAYNPSLPYSSEPDALESRIVDAAHAMEDVIESHIVDQITSGGEKFTSNDALYDALEKLIEEIVLIEKEAMEIEQTLGVQVKHQLHTKSPQQVFSISSSSSSSSSIAEKSKMVGADELLLQMKNELCSDRRSLHISVIVGMGGSGKSTLAKNIYQDRLITEHFHICAWVTISQEFVIREILKKLLEQLDKGASTKDLSEGDLGVMVHKQLFGRRYLIILDDMWDIGAWESIKMFLPNRENGSRIVVTTRLSNLASKLPNHPQILYMKLLDEADSWDLLSRTVFGKEGSPLELEEVGKKISKSCKGLPLSIVVVGGLLSKSEHTIEFWIPIEENLSSVVNLEDDEYCLKTLHMSYKQLPVHLKPCFLYMGVYSEDEKMRISKLIKLWVAEGFIKPVRGKSLEETAKEYLMDLLSRNLILIDKWGSLGNMKYCKIHDLLRDMSIREAQKERFHIPTSSTQGIVNGQRRIVLFSEEAVNALPSSLPLARSFLWHLYESPPPLSFRLLRILQSYTYWWHTIKFLDCIHRLVNSRFLDFHVGNEWNFPDSIWQFWNLQTLILHSPPDDITAPSDIWYMPHIRHVRIFGLQLPDPPKDAIVLGNLQTLKILEDLKLSEQVVKIISNIKKLSIFYTIEPDNEGCCLNNLVFLDQLESFTGSFHHYSGLINFPQSLRKLNLASPLPETILDKISELPLLQKLVLHRGKFDQGHWKTTEDQFRSLKVLHIIDCINLVLWTSESSHFPRLEHLVLYGMEVLQEIPLDFADIATLRVIKIKVCADSVVVSAKRIVEEREEIYGEEDNLQVKVTINGKNDVLQSLATPNFRVTCLQD